jgi:hypothetical protein
VLDIPARPTWRERGLLRWSRGWLTFNPVARICSSGGPLAGREKRTRTGRLRPPKKTDFSTCENMRVQQKMARSERHRPTRAHLVIRGTGRTMPNMNAHADSLRITCDAARRWIGELFGGALGQGGDLLTETEALLRRFSTSRGLIRAPRLFYSEARQLLLNGAGRRPPSWGTELPFDSRMSDASPVEGVGLGVRGRAQLRRGSQRRATRRRTKT